jgi:hypothetical protein
MTATADFSDSVFDVATINRVSGLATDFLNPYNEYIMLAELVADGSMTADVLDDWSPIDYESHFAIAHFAGGPVVLAAYRSLPRQTHELFEDAVNLLIDAILAHRQMADTAPGNLAGIRHRRDAVAALISGGIGARIADQQDVQAGIDALFD